MPPLTITIKKKTDGSAALSCRRADGSVTWQRQDGAQGRFFPLHDLTHFAVESVLGLTQAFYGHLADGWNFDDFGRPWPRGAMHPDAGGAELIVGFFDSERAAGVRFSAEDFREKARIYYDGKGPMPGFLDLDDAVLERIRTRRAELFAAWNRLPAGESLELVFPPSESVVPTRAASPGRDPVS